MYPDFLKQKAKRIVAADLNKKYTQVLRELADQTPSFRDIALRLGLDSEGKPFTAPRPTLGLRVLGCPGSGKTQMLNRLGREALAVGHHVVTIDERDTNHLGSLGDVSTVSDPGTVTAKLKEMLDRRKSPEGQRQAPVLLLIDGAQDWSQHSGEMGYLMEELAVWGRAGNLTMVTAWMTNMDGDERHVPTSTKVNTNSLTLGADIAGPRKPGIPRYLSAAVFSELWGGDIQLGVIDTRA